MHRNKGNCTYSSRKICVCVSRALGVEEITYLLLSYTLAMALTPGGNIATCVLTLTKKTEKTAPLSALFTSLD